MLKFYGFWKTALMLYITQPRPTKMAPYSPTGISRLMVKGWIPKAHKYKQLDRRSFS